MAQYLEYTLSDIETVNIRAEVYRDDNGFFVSAFPNNIGYGNNNFVVRNLVFPARLRLAPAELGPPMARSPLA